MSGRRLITFTREVPGNIRLCGGILNPWLWHAVRATWLRTGPPSEPLNLTDEEWDSFLACLAPEDIAPAADGGSHRKETEPSVPSP